jgi:hypothetical protein
MYVYGVDIQLNIHLMYTGIRRIGDQIFIWCMQGSGGLPTEYSVGVHRDPVDYWLNIQLMCAGIQWIMDQIFIWCMQGSGGVPIGYLLIGLCGLELNIQLLEWSDQVDWNWIFNIWNDGMKQLNIQ